MKKSYEKPSLAPRGKLSKVTAIPPESLVLAKP